MFKLQMHSKEITSANTLKVEIGSNCPQGGDAGHGGRTVFRLSDLGGTALECRVNGGQLVEASKIEIILSGDCEFVTFKEALKFSSSVLETHYQMTSFETKEETFG